MNPVAGASGRCAIKDTLGDGTSETAVDGGTCPLERRRGGVDQRDGHAGCGGDLGDAGAHRAGADNGDRRDAVAITVTARSFEFRHHALPGAPVARLARDYRR